MLITRLGLLGTALMLADCARLPTYASRPAEPQLVQSSPQRAPAPPRGRRVAAHEENPPVAAAEREPLPAAGETAAPSEEDAQAARDRRSEQREQAIKRRMNSICTGC